MNLSKHDPLFGPLLNVVSPQHSEYYRLKMNMASFTTAISILRYVSICLQCSLACHKKCLETLAIQCGHKKLQGRLHLFGIDFTQAAKNSQDGIPFIIRKCTSEIENRALNIKVFSVKYESSNIIVRSVECSVGFVEL